MKKQIVIAIALPIVLASATSSFAGEVVKKPVIIPSTVKPIVSAPVIGGQQTNRPGETSVGKKPVKPPKPPRRDSTLVNQTQILQPVNFTRPNRNINPALGY